MCSRANHAAQFDLVSSLGEHVQVVDHNTLAAMVAQKEGLA